MPDRCVPLFKVVDDSKGHVWDALVFLREVPGEPQPLYTVEVLAKPRGTVQPNSSKRAYPLETPTASVEAILAWRKAVRDMVYDGYRLAPNRHWNVGDFFDSQHPEPEDYYESGGTFYVTDKGHAVTKQLPRARRGRKQAPVLPPKASTIVPLNVRRKITLED